MVIDKEADFDFNMAKDKEADCHRCSSPEDKSADIFCTVEESKPPACHQDSGENKLARKTKAVPLLQELCQDILGHEGWDRRKDLGILLHKGNVCLLVMNHEEEDDVEEEEELVEPHVTIFSTLNAPQRNEKFPRKAEVNLFILDHRQGSGSELRADVGPLRTAGFDGHDEGSVDRPSPIPSDSHLSDMTTDTVTTVSVPRDYQRAPVESSWAFAECSEQLTNVELCIEDCQVSINNTAPVFSEYQNLHMRNPVSTFVLARVLGLVYLSVLANVVLFDEEDQGDDVVNTCSNSKSSADENHDCMTDLAPRKNEDVHLEQCYLRKADKTSLEHELGREDEKLHVTKLSGKAVEVQTDLPDTQDAETQTVHSTDANHEGWLQVNLFSTKDEKVQGDWSKVKKEEGQTEKTGTKEEDSHMIWSMTRRKEMQTKFEAENKKSRQLKAVQAEFFAKLWRHHFPLEVMDENRAESRLGDRIHSERHSTLILDLTRRTGDRQHEGCEAGTEVSSDRFSPCRISNTAVTESVLNEDLPADCCDFESLQSSTGDQGVTGFSNEDRNCSVLDLESTIDTGNGLSVLKMSHDDTDTIPLSGNSDCENTDRERTDCENINCQDNHDKNGDCKDTDGVGRNYKIVDPKIKSFTSLSTHPNRHKDIRMVNGREQADAKPTWVKTLPRLCVSGGSDKKAGDNFFKESNTKSSKNQRRKEKEMQDESTDEEEEAVLSPYYRTDCIPPQFTPWVVSMLRTSQTFTRDYMSEWGRLATFGDLQVPPGIFIIRIANNGFFLRDSPEPSSPEGRVRVECAFCGVRVPLAQFRGRRVEEVHRQVSPSCRFVSGAKVDNVSISGSAQRGSEVSPSTALTSSAPGSGPEPSGRHVPAQHGFQSSLPGPSGEVLQTDACSDQPHSTMMAATAYATAAAVAAYAAAATQNGTLGTNDGSRRNVTSFSSYHTNAQTDCATSFTALSASHLPTSSHPMSTPTTSSSSSTSAPQAPSNPSSSPSSTNVAPATPSAAAARPTFASSSSSSSFSSTSASDFGRSAIAANAVAPGASTGASSSGAGIPATAGGQNTFVNNNNGYGRSENAREGLPMEWESAETPSNSAAPGFASVAASPVSATAAADAAIAAAARTDGVYENQQSAAREVAAAAENASGRGQGGGGESGDGGGDRSSSAGSEGERQTVTYEDLGIFSQRPKRTDMAVTQVRIQTFANWPHEETHPAAKMAEAGFYYTGHVDLVRCFYCKGGLKTWERSDQPWVEHCRWFPRCPYVRLAKGQRFVDIVQRMTTTASNNSNNGSSSSCQQATIREERVTEEVQKMEKEESKNLALVTAQTMNNGQAFPPVDPFKEVLTREGLCPDVDISEDNWGDLSERLQDEREEIRNVTLCKMCQVEEVNILFLPCGHLVACAQCAPALRTCAICRQPVKGSVRVRMTDDDDVTGGHDTQPEGATLGEANSASHRFL